MENSIGLREIINILKKRIMVILGVVLSALLISAIVTFFVVTPQYEASTQILVNQSQTENQEISSTDLQSSRELVSTYNVIMTSPAILNPVIEKSGFEGSIEDLRAKINVSAEEESQIATVTVQDSQPRSAVNLVNTLAQTFEEEIPNIMDVDNVSILSEAQFENSSVPVSPQPLLNLIIAAVLGVIIGVGIAFLLEFLDKTIKEEQDIEKELDLPILGVVPIMSNFDMKNTSTNSSLRTKQREKEKKSS